MTDPRETDHQDLESLALHSEHIQELMLLEDPFVGGLLMIHDLHPHPELIGEGV